MSSISTKQPTANKGKSRIQSLQALRALAFAGVFFTHRECLPAGRWGVSVFLILSGFLMMYSYYKKDLPDNLFFSAKFSLKKIWKLYILHALLTWLLIPYCWGDTLSWPPEMIVDSPKEKLVVNLLLLQSWYPRWTMFFSFNGASWYLSTSLFIYFCFPKILKILKKQKSEISPYLCIAIVYILQFVIGYYTSVVHYTMRHTNDLALWVTYIFPPYRLGDFIIGCNLCKIYLNNNRKESLNNKIYTLYEIITLAVVAVSLYIFIYPFSFIPSNWYIHTIMFTPSSIRIVYLFAKKAGLITKLLTNKFMIFIGNISPYGFLIHNAVIIILKTTSMYSDKTLFVSVALLLTVTLSSVCLLSDRLLKKLIHK